MLHLNDRQVQKGKEGTMAGQGIVDEDREQTVVFFKNMACPWRA